MQVVPVVGSARADNRNGQPHRKTSFEVDPATMTCEVNYDEAASFYISQDPVEDVVVVGWGPGSNRAITTVFEGLLESVLPCAIHLIIEPHSHECLVSGR